MLRLTSFASVILLLASCATTPPPAAAHPPTQTFHTGRVELYRFNGQFVAAVNGDGKPVVAWVRGKEAGYTEDRLPILAIAFTGTPDKDGISVGVTALANAGNAVKEEDLKKVFVATYHVGPGQSIPVSGLERYGMPPMLLRGIAATTRQ